MTNESNTPPPKKKRSIVTTLKILILFLVVIVAAAVLLPTPILRVVCSRIEAQSGIALTFDKAYFYFQDGSFLYIKGLSIKRQNHHNSNFDLKAENVRMPAMVPKDFRSPIFVVSGLRGTYEKIANAPTKNHNTRNNDVTIHALFIEDAEVDVIDRSLEVPFHTTVHVKLFNAVHSDSPSLFAPYTCSGIGQIDTARFIVNSQTSTIEIAEVPIGLFAPYAPVLDDIFDSGSMNININDLTDASQKRLRVSVKLLQDCEMKSADAILAPAIRAALQQLDQSSIPALHDLKAKIDRLKLSSESIRKELDKIVPIIDQLKMLAPRDVREKYETFKSRYDRAVSAYDEWNGKFEVLVRDIDRIKVRIVEDTFQRFIDSGVPIEFEVLEADGEWQYDVYDTVVRLVEQNYRVFVSVEYQKRIQEMREVVDSLFVP